MANIVVGAPSDYYKLSVTASGNYKIHSYIQYDDDTVLDLRNSCLNLDKNIEEIGPRAFADNFKGQNYTAVIIPSSVKRIEDGAFKNCTSLTSVTFEANSQLEYIGAEAFYGCTGLTSVSLPNTLQHIGTESFSRTGLTVVTIGDNVNFIGNAAFGGISSLQSISVSSSNPSFCAIDGNLYSKTNDNADKIYQYIIGKSATTFTLPNSVTEVMPYAFANACNLESVNLQNVTIIRANAFSGCEKLTSVLSTKVEMIEKDSFSHTPYINSSTDFLILGKVLLRYNGTQSVMEKESLSGIESIASGAISLNTHITKLFIPGSVDFVFSNAIYGCPNLSEIITYNTLMVHDNAILGCSSNLKITVPYNLYEEFSNDESWNGYELQTKLVNVTFDAQGGIASYTGQQIYFGDQITSLPTASKEGAIFSGWYLSPTSTKEYEIDSMFDIYENVTLYAQYDNIEVYTITYVLSGGINNSGNPDTYTSYDDTIELLAPSKDGFVFDGWYNEESYDTKVRYIVSGSSENKTLFAKWVELFTLHFKVNNSVVMTASSIEYGSSYTLPSYSILGKKVVYWSDTSNTPGSTIIVTANQTLNGVLDIMSLEETGNKIYYFEQLDEFRDLTRAGNNFAGQTVLLMNSITLPETSWEPITNFQGVFDGRNNTIYNLHINYISASSSNVTKYLGFFDKIYGEVKNLTFNQPVVSLNMKQKTYFGVFAGELYIGANLTNCHVIGITTSKLILGENDTHDLIMGGLIGYSKNGSILKCSVNYNIKADTEGDIYCGGLVGFNTSGSINESFAKGEVKAYSTANGTSIYCGGLVGYCSYNSSYGGMPEIYNCYSTNYVYSDCIGDDGYSYAGGCFGLLSQSEVRYCYTTGTVKARNQYYNATAGGFAAKIVDCTSGGFVTNILMTNDVYAHGNYHGAERRYSYYGRFCGAESNNSFLTLYYDSASIFKDGETGTEIHWDTSWYTGKSDSQIKTIAFQQNELGLSSTYWKFTAGSLPKLKWEA